MVFVPAQPMMNTVKVIHSISLGNHSDSYPSRVDHTFRSTRGSRGVHNEKRMTEWKLLKLQLRELVALTTARCQEIIYVYTVDVLKEREREKY